MSAIPQRLGRYELQKLLGRGSVGEVWKGYDLQARRNVAIKIFHTDLQSDPNFMTRFMQEGQVLTSLQHPNIVQVRDVNISRSAGSGGSTAYLVMDYIEGQTLADHLHSTARTGEFPSLPDIVHLFTGLCIAIDYAHQQGVIHGNIKPGNILRNKEHISAGEPMLTDFGEAALLGSSGSNRTPLYISPEQAKGQPATERSDIYSLGIILYEMCTGVQPFHGESSLAIMKQHINTLPTPPILINSNIPLGLSEVILRAIAKDPATRFRTASALARAIAHAGSMQPSARLMLNDATLEEEFTYHTESGPLSSILGVSQPLPTVTPRSTTAKLPTAPTSQSGALAVPNGEVSHTAKNQAVYAAPPAAPSTPPSITVPPMRRQRGIPLIYIGLTALLLFVIVGGALGSLWLLNLGSKQATTAGSLVGHVFFQDDAQGHNDLLRIDMRNIPAPPQGKSYYAWLEGTAQNAIPLGQLTVQNGSITFLYPGDASHTNLLSVAQGFYVTLENNGSAPPQAPPGPKVYQGRFNPASFQYIKNILYMLPGFPEKTSIIAGLFEAIKEINEKTISIVDVLGHDNALVLRQATRIIELIDGSQYARSSGDLPANYPSMLNARVGLISSPTTVGYIDTLATLVNKIKQTTGNDTELLQHVQNVSNAIADLRDWVKTLHDDDVQLLNTPDLNTSDIMSIALQLKQIAGDAYTGRTIPPNQGPQPILGSAGANQAYIECQYMATLDIRTV